MSQISTKGCIRMCYNWHILHDAFSLPLIFSASQCVSTVVDVGLKRAEKT